MLSFTLSDYEKTDSNIDSAVSKYKSMLCPVAIPSYRSSFDDLNVFCYSCDSARYEELKLKFRDKDKLRVHNLDKSFIILGKSKLVFIMNEIRGGLVEIINFLTSNTISSDIKIKLQLAKYEISRLSSRSNSEILKIKKLYHDVVVTPHGLDIYSSISPNKLIFGKNPVKMRSIPRRLQKPISKTVIYIDKDYKINSVYIDQVHPNADKGWFCLGKMRGETMTLDNVNKLVNTIKIYDLSDCYFIPREVECLMEVQT